MRLVIALLGLAVLAGADEKTDADREAIQGAWILTGLEINGNTIPAPEGGGIFVFDKDGKLVMKEKGKKDREGTYQLDASKKPRQIDLNGPKGKDGFRMRGIYQLDGDVLRIAFAMDGPKGERPAAFDSKKAAIMILKRQKS